MATTDAGRWMLTCYPFTSGGRKRVLGAVKRWRGLCLRRQTGDRALGPPELDELQKSSVAKARDENGPWADEGTQSQQTPRPTVRPLLPCVSPSAPADVGWRSMSSQARCHQTEREALRLPRRHQDVDQSILDMGAGTPGLIRWCACPAPVLLSVASSAVAAPTATRCVYRLFATVWASSGLESPSVAGSP